MQGSTAREDGFVKPGDVVAGKYAIVRVIGEGGMGIVVEAVHQKLDQRVAIKFHRPQTSGNDESVARFLREAKAAAQIRSEHVVRVTDVAMMENGAPYFVMEYLEGRDLDAVIQAEGPLSIASALDYTLQVCEALAEAHSLGIVHRDLKPANLFLSHRADGSVVIKLLDFGISKTLPKGTEAELSMTKTRALMGSPLYMAPEQMRSTRRVDHRADIWSLGVLMHEMLTGETPFEGETLPEVCSSIAADDPIPLTSKRHDAPPELEDVVLRCLEKEPERRFDDVAELAMALGTLAPPEASRSVGRIVRVLRGQLSATTPPPTAVSLRSTSPSLRAKPLLPSIPTDRPSDPNADTLCIEPSDQKKSGVAPKLRIRASSPGSAAMPGLPAVILETPDTDVAITHASPPSVRTSSRVTTFIAGGVAFMVATGLFALVLRVYQGSPSTTAAPARTAIAERPTAVAPPPAPAQPASANAARGEVSPTPPSDNASALTIEFVDLPNSAAVAPAGSAHPRTNTLATKTLPKGERADAVARPAASASSGAQVGGPAPSGTAAFGAARD
jgi:eukaryotic-like serine/threonine-protein kinase